MPQHLSQILFLKLNEAKSLGVCLLYVNLNPDHLVVPEIRKLEHQMCFSELNETRVKRWDEQWVITGLGGAQLQAFSK